MLIQFVKFKSGLSEDDIIRVVNERAPEYEALPGLLQKFYGLERESGEACGVYIWDSEESLRAFRQSELAKTIPVAYEAIGSPRVEIFELIRQLRTEQAPAGSAADSRS